MLTGLSIRATGKKISNTGKEKKTGLMVLATQGAIVTEKSMEKGNSYGQTKALTKVNLLKTTSTGKGNTAGQTEGSLKGIGSTTKCMERVFSRGQTVAGTRGNITTTRNMAMECSPGLMAGSTTGSGSMASKRGSGSTTMQRGRSGMENGLMERGSAGYRKTSSVRE